MMKNMRASEIFEKFIDENGMYPVFGNPGTTEIPMLRNVKKYYLTLHDSISVGMAEGRSDYTGRPTIVNLHSLPGISNSMAFIFSAYKNRSPLIITAGQQDRRHLFYDPLLSGDQIPMVDGYVKYAYEVREANEIPSAMRRAAEIAMEPPMGPVFLSFPMDLMDSDGDYREEKPFYSNYGTEEEKSVKEISDAINEHKNVAIVFGYEIDSFGGYNEAINFAERLNVPVFTESWPIRSVFDSGNRHYYGSLPLTAAGINYALKDFDLILFIGGDIFIYPYTNAEPLAGKECIFVGFDLSHRTGKSYRMNPVSFMRSAMNYIKPKEKFEHKNIPEPPVASGIMRRVSKLFGDYSIVDEAVTGSAAVQRFLGNMPKGYYSSRAGPLGWGDSATVGVSTVSKKTLGIIGDGAFMYTVQSLWTASNYGLPAKFLVLKNNAYNILRSYSKAYGYGIEDESYLKFDLDVVKISESFGIHARKYSSDDDLLWLRDGNEPKVLVYEEESTIPEMF